MTALIDVFMFSIMGLILLALTMQIAVWFLRHLGSGSWQVQPREFHGTRHRKPTEPPHPVFPTTQAIVHPIPTVASEPPGEVEIRLDLTRVKRNS